VSKSVSKSRAMPSYIYCPRCGSKVEMVEDESREAVAKAREHGYEAMARGACECGAVYVLCRQPLPASPTFSLFFDIYPAEVVKRSKLISSATN